MSYQVLQSRVLEFNLASPGNNISFGSFSTASVGAATPPLVSTVRVAICLTTASVLNLIRTQGATSFTDGLNKSVALQAGDEYTFTIPVNSATTYAFQLETTGIIRFLQVDELVGGGFSISAPQG